MCDIEEKICNECKINKDIIYFKIIDYSKKKYCDSCIDCSEEVKQCEKCNIVKKLYDYKIINKYKKKYNVFCNECFEIINEEKKQEREQKNKEIKENKRIKAKKRYEENKEKILSMNKKWRDNNKEYRSIKDKEYRNKPEIKEHIKEYLEKNKEKNKERSKKYYENHKIEKKEYDKEYRIKNKEKILQKKLENPEYYKDKRKKHYNNNKEKITMKNRIRRKATNKIFFNYMNTVKPILSRKLNSKILNKKYDVSVNIDDLTKLWDKQDGKCYLTEIKMDTVSYSRTLKNVSIDQIEAGKGYTIDNIGLCCESINMAKMQMTKEDFLTQLKLAGENIKNNFYNNTKQNVQMEINDDCKKYLLTLFDNKRIKNKIGEKNIINLWKKQNGKCAITGIDMTYEINTNIKFRNPTNISVDKINPKFGYVLDNIHLTCLWANTGKLIYSVDEFRNLLLEGYNNIIA